MVNENERNFQYFLLEGLKLDPESIKLVDIHCLPQHPIVRDNQRIIRSIIIKVTNALDKQLIMSKVGDLKDYNNHRQKQNA